MTKEELDNLTQGIIGIAIQVHKELGPGLLEKIYTRCMRIALEEVGFRVQANIATPVVFRGKTFHDDGFYIDLLVNDTVVLEIKSVSVLTPVMEKQLGTYVRMADKPCGLLLNFNVALLKDGLRRVINGFLPSNLSFPSVPL